MGIAKNHPMLLSTSAQVGKHADKAATKRDAAQTEVAGSGEGGSVATAVDPEKFIRSGTKYSENQAYQSVNNALIAYFSQISDGMDALQNIGTQLSQTLSQIRTSGHSITQTAFNDTIDGLIDQFQAVLMTDYNGEYIFSGAVSDQPPVGDIKAGPSPATGSLPTNDFYLHQGIQKKVTFKANSLLELTNPVNAGDSKISELHYALKLAQTLSVNSLDKTRAEEAHKYAISANKEMPGTGKIVNNLIKTLRTTNEELNGKQVQLSKDLKTFGYRSVNEALMDYFQNKSAVQTAQWLKIKAHETTTQLAQSLAR